MVRVFLTSISIALQLLKKLVCVDHCALDLLLSLCSAPSMASASDIPNAGILFEMANTTSPVVSLCTLSGSVETEQYLTSLKLFSPSPEQRGDRPASPTWIL